MSEGLGEWDDELEVTALPTEPADEEDSDAPELFYPNVAEFVSGKLATSYRRQINVQGGVTWCPQWWKHAEAISRLEALWRAWEFLRLDGTTGMSVWWRDHADHHMSVLLSTDGPFKGCTPDDGHRSKLAPLPCEEPPAGLF
ncbi:DUF4913 domain-containing protein [Pseudarthrobacter enclensis]|uniref:DUF4913 domain-containing protein n=1 Tax=Pseudarthrobacter enclensis TaxID=993070 RepID=A0ABT9RXJ9_9MICC|nr:DUF4913 domain-containing protein [Pseudarthrobacter enclensis]MDP9889970.1 hypothetical protein [Pseudarthrobacter enclensis]